MVELFIKYGALIPSGDSHGDTINEIENNAAINAAIGHGFYDIAKCLLEHGATSKGLLIYQDKFKEVGVMYTLAYAAYINRIDLIELLIKHGANISDTLRYNLCNFSKKNLWIENHITNRDELLENRNSIFEAYRSSLGQESSIFKFFGRPAYKKNPDGTDTMHPDRHVLQMVKGFLM